MVKNILSKYNLLIIILVFIVFLAAAVNYITFPLINKVEETSYAVQAKMIDRELEDARLESLPRLEADWISYESKKYALNVVLGQETELDFIKGVEAMAEKSGNSITLKINPEGNLKDTAKTIRGVVKKEGTKEKGILEELKYAHYFPIQISLKGDYIGLINFLHLLENNQYYVNIISLDLKKGVEDGKEAEPAKTIFNPDEPAVDKGEQAVSKEIINSIISAIVYTKKP